MMGPLSMDGYRFRPAWWLPGPHAQTLWPALARRPTGPDLRRERLDLADGDFVDLHWGPAASGPLVLVLHGLAGCARSAYVLGLVGHLARHGFESVVMEYRGAGAEPNRLPRLYHAGAWEDPAEVVTVLRRRWPARPLGAVGVSLGGSILLNWLGRQGAAAPVDAAVAVSVPFDLAASADAAGRASARLYQWDLVRHLKAGVRRHPALGLDRAALAGIRSLRGFDDVVTAPLHGFAGADDYYRRCSCGPCLPTVRRPTLVIHGLDDPLVPPSTLPDRRQLPPALRLELSRHGGHVGFVGGRWPWRAEYWIEQRARRFLARALDWPHPQHRTGGPVTGPLRASGRHRQSS